MLRFIAFVWDGDDPNANHHVKCWSFHLNAMRWSLALDAPGLKVHYRVGPFDPPPQTFCDNRGIVLGWLFRRENDDTKNGYDPVASLTPSDVTRIVATGGSKLIECYWGDYVALFKDESSTIVLRGPSATLPCLHLSTEGIHVWFSEMESCARILNRPFRIAWSHLARTFLGPEVSEETHLDGVEELLPGFRANVSSGCVHKRLLWDPIDISRRAIRDSPSVVAKPLRAMTRRCVQTRAAPFHSVLVGLSGGLDSTITLVSLLHRTSARRITCLTQYSDSPESDERMYARIAANHAGRDLIEVSRDRIPDLRSARHQRCSEVSPGLRIPAVDRIEPDTARNLGAQAIFRGHGGDEIFCRNRLSGYVGDYLQTQRSLRGMSELLLHAAFTDGVTVWTVLARAVRDALWGRPRSLAAEVSRDLPGSTLLHSGLITELQRTTPSNPYFQNATRVPPGRSWQIGLLCARRQHFGPFDEEDDPVPISPLLSQPLIELCLRIPTWYQMAGRRDRALARAAFAEDIPPQILYRRDKGGAESLAAATLRKNLNWIRELVLDGLVVKSGIIDRRALEGALADSPSTLGVTSVALFDLLGAEIWAQACQRFNATVYPRRAAP